MTNLPVDRGAAASYALLPIALIAGGLLLAIALTFAIVRRMVAMAAGAAALANTAFLEAYAPSMHAAVGVAALVAFLLAFGNRFRSRAAACGR